MKRFEGLEARLELQRLPKGLRTPGDIKMLTARLTYKALNDNKAPTENFTRSVAKLNRKEEIQAIIDSGEQIIVKSCDELEEFIAAVLGKTLQDANINGYNTQEEYENTTLAFIFIFFARSIGFSTEDMKKGRHLPMTTGVMNDPKRHEQTGLHIIQNHPALLVLGKKMGLNFKTTGNGEYKDGGLKLNIKRSKVITIKKGHMLDETLDNVCSKLELDMEGIFKINKTGIEIRKWKKIQRNTVHKLCFILGKIYQGWGDKTKIADVISKKIGWNKLTILSQYSNSQIKELEVRIEN